MKLLPYEVWEDVPGYEGYYQVSSMGNIRSFHRGGRILKPHVSRNGYQFVFLSNDTSKTYWFVHRIVAITFIPNPHNYPIINHKDENKLNCSVSNLEWCTYTYNLTYGSRSKH